MLMTPVDMFSYYRSLHSRLNAKGIRCAPLAVFSRFYTEPHRFYHNYDHLAQLYAMHHALKHSNHEIERDLLTNKLDMYVELFIWWHDIIYDPMRQDNELTSAQLFELTILNPNGVSWELSSVYSAIINSKHLGEKPKTPDKWPLYCLDLDLSAMISKTSFDNNGILIRKEFAHLSDEIFYTGRKTFFQKLLARGYIFHNPYDLRFFRDGEKSVVNNIQAEIKNIEEMESHHECGSV